MTTPSTPGTDPVTPRKRTHMTWDYLLSSPAFSAIRSREGSPDRNQLEVIESQESQPESQSEEQVSAAQAEIDAAVAGSSPPKVSEPEIVEEEEEEAEAEAKGPRSPPVERYVDESWLDLEDETAVNENYEEAFMMQFERAYHSAIAAFVLQNLKSAYDNSTKPLSSDSFWAFRAGPVSQYAAEQLKWVDVPGSTEHLSFARSTVEPNVTCLRLFLSEVKKRKWG
jgi:hypothetical protein